VKASELYTRRVICFARFTLGTRDYWGYIAPWREHIRLSWQLALIIWGAR
jgi:hypothetical protein